MIIKSLHPLKHHLLQSAKAIVEQHAAALTHFAPASLCSIAMAYFDTDLASVFLAQTLASSEPIIPLQGVALFHLYQQAKDKQAIRSNLPIWYASILQQHRDWYERNDLHEEGLPHASQAAQHLQDPVFLALLVWSNENLIQVGQLIKADVLEIIQWNELTTFAVNEKLWNAEQHCYQPFDQIQNHLVEADFCSRFAPLVGEIPTQDRAELLLSVIQGVINQATRINFFEWWLLWLGLRRYDFDELAASLRKKMLYSIQNYGFYENFDAKSGEPLPSEKAQSGLAAALTIDLLKRC